MKSGEDTCAKFIKHAYILCEVKDASNNSCNGSLLEQFLFKSIKLYIATSSFPAGTSMDVLNFSTYLPYAALSFICSDKRRESLASSMKSPNVAGGKR